jgi:serine protease Do
MQPVIVRKASRIAVLFLCSVTGLGQQSTGKPAQNPVPPKPDARPELGKELGARTDEAPEILQQFNTALQNLAARVSPAVVQVVVSGLGPVNEGSDKGQTALVARQRAVGSGIIVDSDGYIMTNAHVVENAQRIRVILPLDSSDPASPSPEGKQHVLNAKLIGMHKETDLALLKVEARNLPTLSLGAAHRVRQGQLAFAIGSPEGLQNSITMGIVSSVARQADPTKAMVYIQTDAPINPGNSGGPLVDVDGYVLGMNTFILSEGGGSEGIGFAIPARVLRFVYQSLRKYGHVHRVEVQAGAQTITPDLAEGLNLTRKWGVIIDDVTPDGPADKAGLKVGDILITADDRQVDTLPAFTAVLYLHPLDEVLKMEVLRGKEKKTLYIPVTERRDPMDRLLDEVNPEQSLIPALGVLGITIDDRLRAAVSDLRIPTGVVVVARAAELITPDAGLQTGDVIHSVNQTTVASVEELRTAMERLKPGSPTVLQIERGGGLQWVSFETE